MLRMHDAAAARGPQGPAGTPMPPARSLTLNITYQHKKASRCMSNCRSIEVSVLLPGVPPTLPLNGACPPSNCERTSDDAAVTGVMMLDADQELGLPAGSPSSQSCIKSRSRENSLVETEQPFHFLDLPAEIRLKIYALLLPARAHKIVTQIPHNGSYYSPLSVPPESLTTFYPIDKPEKLTTYKVLSDNFRNEFPSPSIHPEILRTSRLVHAEAESILYGSKDTVWDFGVHLEAMIAFWGDRSQAARQSVRSMKIGREILEVKGKMSGTDTRWTRFCQFLQSEMRGLRELDLVMWSSSGIPFPRDGQSSFREEHLRNWEWTKALLELEPLRNAKVTWWEFPGTVGRGLGLGPWLGGKMVSDETLRSGMVQTGVIIEESLLVST